MLPLTPAAQAAVDRIRARRAIEQHRARVEEARTRQAVQDTVDRIRADSRAAAVIRHLTDRPDQTTRQVADAIGASSAVAYVTLRRLQDRGAVTNTTPDGPGHPAHWTITTQEDAP